MDKHEEATLQWNVVEFVKDLVRLGGKSGISHDTIPGGLATAEEAVSKGYLHIKTKKETYNVYELRFGGLLLFWEHSDTNEPFVSCKVAKD